MNGVLPDDLKLAEKLKKKCSWFELWNDTLYKKSYSRPLLRCVTPEKGREILEDLHQRMCGSHILGRALAENAVRTGYYWPTLGEDALSLVKRFRNTKLTDWLVKHGIAGYFASVGRPQANGKVEAFNNIISEGMKKKLDEAKGLWEDELPNFLWSIRTTTKKLHWRDSVLTGLWGRSGSPH
ncbi:uncharacterized protein [Spinacia oleracea]|uniref:Integrase catalytic domain-containing protein n=1 Tax=Spinacia oleracea TaxID=3562 RepID=A0ABM3RR31_SPIOL|nr:uncharacterized protein LOC130471792 [Spinacia oleracea]